MKKQIFILGAGGFGKEVYKWLREDLKPDESIKGFLSGSADDIKGEKDFPPYLGTIDGYAPEIGDVFLLAIGDINARKKIVSNLKEKGASFYSFVHSSCVVTDGVKIGEGCIVAPLSVISNNAVVSDFVAINTQCLVGHDAFVGDHCVLSPLSGIMGGVVLSAEVFLGANATVAPRLKIGKGSKISIGTSVLRDVPENCLVAAPMPKVMPLALPG